MTAASSFDPGDFVPARALRAPDAQTIVGNLARPTHRPQLGRERWDTPDGDFVDVDLLPAAAAAPHLLVLHGLEGSSKAGYVAAMLRGAHARQWGAAALNFRSCSDAPNRLLRSYHSGETGDALQVIARWRGRFSGPLLAVGFSLGGNVLLRILEETGSASPIDAAAAVSVPFDLARCARNIDSRSPALSLYRLRFLRTLKRKALAKSRRFPGRFDVDRISRLRGIVDYDDAVTAPVHGFASAAEYYARSSSGPAIGEIRRPTLLLSSRDDPMVPGETIPDRSRLAARTTLVATRHGGHVGFLAGSLWRPQFWGDELVLRYFDRVVATG